MNREGGSTRMGGALIIVVGIEDKEEELEKETSVYNAPVLVLNQNFEPLNVCNVKRALVLVLCGKAEVLELNHQVIHTPTLSIHCPSVIRLSYMIRRPRPRARLSRK